MDRGIEGIGVAMDTVDIAAVGNLKLDTGRLWRFDAPREDPLAKIPVLLFRNRRRHFKCLSLLPSSTHGRGRDRPDRLYLLEPL